MANVQTKTCSKCQTEKPIAAFYSDKASPTGLMYVCKACSNEYDRQRSGTLRRKARLALKDSRRARHSAEKATGRTITDDLTVFDVMLALGDETCTFCGKETEQSDRTLDHLTSMRYNGNNTFSNVTMACRGCNSAKNEKPAITYMLQIDRPYHARKLIDRLAYRRGITFQEAFRELAEDARAYYVSQAVSAT